MVKVRKFSKNHKIKKESNQWEKQIIEGKLINFFLCSKREKFSKQFMDLCLVQKWVIKGYSQKGKEKKKSGKQQVSKLLIISKKKLIN